MNQANWGRYVTPWVVSVFALQLSSLKLELAAQGKAVPSFDPQSAVVTQLQEEVNQLRAQLKMGKDRLMLFRAQVKMGRDKGKGNG